MSSTILSVATAIPEHRLDPADALRHLRSFFPQLEKLEEAEATLGTRYTCEPVEQLLRPRNLDELRDSYTHHARRLATSAACKALQKSGLSGADIDLIITVSCTGYLVPSLDVHMADELGLRPDAVRLPITELGCSAGAAAISAAHRHLVAYPEQKVLVVAVEITSLNFHPADESLDNLTASLVFGDGAGAAVLGQGDGLQVVGAASYLIPRTAHLLGFDLRDTGFHVVLDRRLPRILERELRPVVDRFLATSDLREPRFYAVHAAGPRIFDTIQSALALPAHALDASRQVFAEVGNTSSSAIFFTLEKLLAEEGHGLGIGIGPGVSLELMHLARNPASNRRTVGNAGGHPTSIGG
jgi:predicted naringenin-chalcone synthase